VNDSNATVIALDQGGGAQPPTSTACIWCGRPFRARRGGSPKRFCSAAHRIEFWSELRRWSERAVVAGVLTVDRVKNDDSAACTVLSGGISPAPVFPTEKPAPAPVAPTERPQHVVIALDHMQQMQLRELRWGDPFHPAAPEELAAMAGRLLRAEIPRWLMRAADAGRTRSHG